MKARLVAARSRVAVAGAQAELLTYNGLFPGPLVRPFQVWRHDGAPPPIQAWRDTVNLRPGERVELLVPFRDFAGTSLFHCHIAEHGDAGMMGVVEVTPG